MGTISQTALTIQKIREDVTDLEKDMAKVGMLVDRLDITIDKLGEVSNNISKLIVIHETKLDYHAKQNLDILNELKIFKDISTDEHLSLDKRISVMEKWMWLIVGGSIVSGFIINILVKLLLK